MVPLLDMHLDASGGMSLPVYLYPYQQDPLEFKHALFCALFLLFQDQKNRLHEAGGFHISSTQQLPASRSGSGRTFSLQLLCPFFSISRSLKPVNLSHELQQPPWQE